MPTYEYYCKKCDRTFDYFQSIVAEPLKTCPRDLCSDKGSVERRLGSGGGILFKGSGFYATDYRSSDYQAKKKADQAPSSESKPESKSGKSGE